MNRIFLWNLAGPAVMLGLVAGCGQSDAPDDAPAPPPPPAAVKTAAQALEGANIPVVDPATLNDAEVGKVIGSRPRCTFRYTSAGRPVVVAGLAADGRPELGVTKLNGNLVVLQPGVMATGLRPGGFELVADAVRLRVQPDSSADAARGRVDAEMVFEVGQALKVGYGGYLECGAGASAPAQAR